MWSDNFIVTFFLIKNKQQYYDLLSLNKKTKDSDTLSTLWNQYMSSVWNMHVR